MTNQSTSDPDHRPEGRLALADGSLFRGRPFGATNRGLHALGEVVFNTAMTGYQESLTDPSYTGQILVETTPLIGNTGVNPEDVESAGVSVRGFVVRELARRHSNYRAADDLDAYLRDAGVLALEGVDTRALTRLLRTQGAITGVITDDPSIPDKQLIEMARAAPSMEGANLARDVSARDEQEWTESLGQWATPADAPQGPPLTVVALDCGAKRNILRNLTQRGCAVRLVPHDIAPDALADLFDSGHAHGLFISNGPGDPAAVEGVIATLRELLFQRALEIPTFGICLGHQLLALALGASTYKLKFGHRGANQPVLDTDAKRVEITSQNHGFAVDAASLEAHGARVTHRHLNDDTVAGFEVPGRDIFAVQYHPEASPGPHDAAPLFDRFVHAMRVRQDARVPG
ncbi:MAG: glutamine-hydrolyzing carbamoyl-phosphate synthase small subunit [Phycisphaerales bacterium JB059]